MGVFTPMPREVNATFQRKYSASPSEATEWYYALSKSLNYVRAERIAKDLKMCGHMNQNMEHLTLL